VATVCTQYMRLRVISDRVGGDDDTADFRDEVLAQIYDRGDPTPKRELEFEIAVTDRGRFAGLLQRRLVVNEGDWTPIGKIVFKEAVASHNGDFVIHFHHPKWRSDRNVPEADAAAGAVPVGGRPREADAPR
jgi:hypothetical protein